SFRSGFPECRDARVNTLPPAVHAGILADRRKPEHVAQLEDLGIAAFDLVVVNLYPFTETVASGASPDDDVLAAVAEGVFTLEQRPRLAVAAFRHTASYDIAVASWMGSVLAPD